MSAIAPQIQLRVRHLLSLLEWTLTPCVLVLLVACGRVMVFAIVLVTPSPGSRPLGHTH